MPANDFSSETLRAINDAARLVLRAKHTVALVGAGLSAESGIPTFRGPGGLWTKKGEPDMRGYQAFLRDPKAWWENRLKPQDPDMEAFTKALEAGRPNPGHYALAVMERSGCLQHIVTQNVDNLHQAAGSMKVAEIHGNRYKVRCLTCLARYHRDEIPLTVLPPRCPRCQGILKGDGVMFGEPIPQDVLGVCQEQAFLADCMLVIGTSALVYPAASLPTIAQQRGAPLIEVNPLPTALSGACDVIIRAPSGQALPYLVERIRALKEDAQ
ncbi:MAG: NAD-dependent protein deacylase [Chloroflexi bacterium]|nr:NAD-dependent protein deacylase [Chloroflexota bacterium]